MNKTRVCPEPGRKYFNHLAEHTRGEWHRHWLLSSGQYVHSRPVYRSWGRIACRHHEDRE